MNVIQSCFGKPKIVLPVIHVNGVDQARRNIEVARDCGADGVFLINHGSVSHSNFRGILSIAVSDFRDWWLGANLLDFEPRDGDLFRFAQSFGLSGIWSDNAYVQASGSLSDAIQTNMVRKDSGWEGLYFGGVAFKYQTPMTWEESAAAAGRAKDFMEVITTSGPATGRKPEIEKIRLMRETIGDHALAIASGITPDNVTDYLPYVDAFLVATGISVNFHSLDPDKTKRLVETVKGYS